MAGARSESFAVVLVAIRNLIRASPRICLALAAPPKGHTADLTSPEVGTVVSGERGRGRAIAPTEQPAVPETPKIVSVGGRCSTCGRISCIDLFETGVMGHVGFRRMPGTVRPV